MKIKTFAGLALILTLNSFATEYYVSAVAKKSGNGSKNKPFNTIQAARDAIRKNSQKGGHIVWLNAGRYFFDKTLEFKAIDSGIAGKPNVYKTKKGSKVYFDGGKIIDPTACRKVTDPSILARLNAKSKDKIFQINLAEIGIEDCGTIGPRGFGRALYPAPVELFIDSQPQKISRFPNRGEKLLQMGAIHDAGNVPRSGDYGLRGGTFEVDKKYLKRWQKASNFYVSGLFAYGYADDTVPVKNINLKKGTLTTKVPHIYGYKNQYKFNKWFALNLIEEIDLPGEYAIENKILYFHPANSISNAQIQLSLLDQPFIALESASYIYFENIIFENARATAIYIEGGTGNRIKGCTMRNLGLMAVQFGQGAGRYPEGQTASTHKGANEGWGYGKPVSREPGAISAYGYDNTVWQRLAGSDHGVDSCDIYNTGAGGVLLGGGDRVTLEAGKNFVRNCDIYKVNRWNETYCTPVNVLGVGNLVQNNNLHDCAGQAMVFSGNDHIIEYNRIHKVLKNMSDQGAIYTGRDPSWSGTKIRYNFFHDIKNNHSGGHGVQAIFFDDMCTFGATVFGNVFLRAGNTGVIKFNGGGDSPIINNIMIDCPRGLQKNKCSTKKVTDLMASPLGQARCFGLVNITNELYASRYPVVADVFKGSRELSFPYKDNYEVRKDYSQFVDPANGNYKLKKDATVYQTIPNFKEIPFEKIGLYKNEYRQEL